MLPRVERGADGIDHRQGQRIERMRPFSVMMPAAPSRWNRTSGAAGGWVIGFLFCPG